MLTREQKLLFSRLIFNAKEILFADSANSEVTKPEKASKWFEILMQLNSVGANIPDYKTIRDQEWSNMRRAVEKKVSKIIYFSKNVVYHKNCLKLPRYFNNIILMFLI